MIKDIEGIIINEIPYSETSKIIHLYTKEYGVIGVLCKGAKSLKSRLRSSTIRFTYGIFHMYYKENKLSTLIEVDVLDDFKNIKTDLLLISYLNYITDLVNQIIKQVDDEKIYDDYINTIKKINSGLNPIVMTNILELKLLPYLGVGLHLDECVKCGSKKDIINIDGDLGGYVCKKCNVNTYLVDPKTIKMLRLYYYVDIKTITELSISNKIVNEINFFINKYYDRYTGLYLYSKSFLESIK